MEILEIIVPIFGTIAVGWALRKIGIIGKGGVKTLNDYAYYIGFPVLVFMSLREVDFIAMLNLELYLVNFTCIFLTIGVAYAVSKMLRFKNELKAAFILCAFFGNIAYMGFPLNRLALGDAAMPFASVIAAIYIIVALTFGLFMLKYYSGVKTATRFWILKVPLIWGIILGLVFSYARLPLPFPQFFTMIADSAAPLALVAVGAFLYGVELNRRRKEIALLGSLKLLLLPLLILPVSSAVGFKGLAFTSSVLQASTPVAVTTFVLAHKFKAESDFVASAIVATTSVSIVTLSLMLHFFI